MTDVIPPTLVDQQQLPGVDRRYLARLRQAVVDLNATLASLTGGSVPSTRTIATTAPLTGGGDLSANRTLALPAADAFGPGYLLASDFNTFNAKEPAIAPATLLPANWYWRGDKTWRDFATDVRAAVLTGLSTASAAVVTTADSVLVAIGKLQAQLTAAKLASGLYTPALSGGVNVTSSVSLFGQYLRVGDIVHFAIQVSVVPTTASTLTSFLLTLPVASALAANSDAIGDGSASSTAVVPATVRGDAATDSLFVSFTPASTASQGVRLVGSYQVI